MLINSKETLFNSLDSFVVVVTPNFHLSSSIPFINIINSYLGLVNSLLTTINI